VEGCLPTEREPRTAIFLFFIVLAAISGGEEEDKEERLTDKKKREYKKIVVTVSGREMRLVATLVYRAVCVGDATADASAAHENKQDAGGGKYVRRRRATRDKDVIYTRIARIDTFSSMRGLDGASLDCPHPRNIFFQELVRRRWPRPLQESNILASITCWCHSKCLVIHSSLHDT